MIIYVGAPAGLEGVRMALDGRGAGVDVRHVAAEPDVVAHALSEAAAFIDASMKVPITDAMVAAAPHLRVISTATTGSDHIDRTELDRRGIPVRTLREDPELLRGLTPAAELTWALLMALARRLVPAVLHVREGGWEREEFPGVMLRGKTLGLVGCGRIGQWLARYARAFDMRVVGHDPFLDPWPDGIDRLPLGEVYAMADFVSVHVHLSDATRGLVDADAFSAMKPTAFFLNTSRGAVAVEAALLSALQSGGIAGAGVDVLDGEPAVADHPLRRYAEAHDNLLITPHCGGFSPDAVRIVCRRATDKALEVLETHEAAGRG